MPIGLNKSDQLPIPSEIPEG